MLTGVYVELLLEILYPLNTSFNLLDTKPGKFNRMTSGQALATVSPQGSLLSDPRLSAEDALDQP